MQFFSSVKRRVANEVSEFFFLPNSDDKKWRERTDLLHARNPIYRNLGLTLRRKPRHVPLSDAPHAVASESFASYMESESPSLHRSSIPSMPPAVSLTSVHPVSQTERAVLPFYKTAVDETDLSFPESKVQKSVHRLPRRRTQRRETVLEMVYNAANSFVRKQSHQQPQKPCQRRSFQRKLIDQIHRSKPDQKDIRFLENPDFFNTPIPTSYQLPIRRRDPLSEVAARTRHKRRNLAGNIHPYEEVDQHEGHLSHIQFYQPQPKAQQVMKKRVIAIDPAAAYFAEYKALDQVDGAVSNGMSKFVDGILALIPNNTNRKVGVGIVGDYLNWDQKDIKFDPAVQEQIDDISSNPYRPYFTFWVTFVQIVCFIFAISVYGISTIGVSETIVEAEVLTKSLSVEKVYYVEEDNMWIGPRQADLIHLGARFSPCMRKDANVDAALLKDRQMENMSACCVLNDGSGCFQSDESSCSKTLANWLRWNGSIEQQFRHSGSVCGLDPSFCLNPQSLPPFVWPDEIISWPICKLTAPSLNIGSKNQQNARTLHMTCPIVGRPCCYGIQGQCIITTREHCTFLRGFFHADLFLCAQVSCMAEICAMLPFVKPDQPDQFYRLFTSLFIHAGIIQLLISVLFQIIIMRDFEKLSGWLRMGIIYVVGGIGGSLASAIFVPYHVEAGPSGSQFSIIGCCVTDIIHNWNVLSSPGWALGKLSLMVVVLFVLGLLPMIDNYAHLFGFIFGFLLSFALQPYIMFWKDERYKRIGVVICLVISVCLFNILVVFFYVSPVNSCPGCHYFNCIPLTENFCKSVEMKIRYYSL